MNNSIHLIGQLVIFLLVAGLLGSLYTALLHGFGRLRLPLAQRKRTARLALLSLLLWMVISLLLPMLGGFERAIPPSQQALLLFALPSVLAAGLLAFRFIRLLLRVMPPQWLVKIQGVRIVVSLQLWLGYEAGYVPPQLTFAWFNYDIIVGLSALLGGAVFFARGQFRRPESLLWNSFGLISLLYLLFIALLSLPGQPAWQVFNTVPDASFLLVPLDSLLLSFVFPFCAAMHLYAIWQALSQPLLAK